MYITLFERVSSLQSRLFLEVLQQSYWKMHAFFKRIDSTGKCNILQKYFDLEVTVSIPKYSMFFFGGVSLYQNARLLHIFVTCTPWGVCNLYKWEMNWMKVKHTHTYIYIIKWKISLNFWIKYKHYISLFVISAWTSFSSRKDSLANSNWVLHVKDFMP